MLVAKIENGNISTIADYRELFPNTGFTSNGPSDEWMSENNVKKVNTYKDYDKLTQKLVVSAPYIEGEWVFTVSVEQLTADEIEINKRAALSELRVTRNNLLSQCDWTQTPDCTIPKKTEWATYRQALRDFPDTVTDARLPVEWPKNPDWVANRGI